MLHCAAHGLSSKEAAQQLRIDYYTEKSHRKKILHKLGARNMTHAVAIAIATRKFE